jgi:hypothetical protein
VVPMVQALAKHIEQLVALPDALRETAVRRFKKLCDSCCWHNERELAATLAEERRPRACPIARLLRACGRLQMSVKLPACLSLGVAGRDTSWQALLMHLQNKASAPGADPCHVQDVMTVSQAQLRASASEHEQKPGVASTAPPGSEAGGYQNSLPAPRSGGRGARGRGAPGTAI